MRSQPLNIRNISHDIRNTKACPASVQNPAGLTMLPRPSLQTTEMLDLCHRRNCSYDTWLKTPKDQQMSHLHRLVRLKPFLSFKAFFFSCLGAKAATAQRQEANITEAQAFNSSWNFFGSHSRLRYQLLFILKRKKKRGIQCLHLTIMTHFLVSGWMQLIITYREVQTSIFIMTSYKLTSN